MKQPRRLVVAGAILLTPPACLCARAWAQAQPASQTAAANAGGTIQGTVLSGKIPLPGVAITAVNTLTGKRYTTSTNLNGTYAMTIPRTGRYVVRAELAAFASATNEVRITPEAAAQTAQFRLELASRVAQTNASSDAGLGQIAAALGRGTQALSVSGLGGAGGIADATAAGAVAEPGVALPSLGGVDGAGAAAESVAVSGQVGQTNGLANLSEDELRQRIEEAVAQARQQGGASGDQANAIVSILGGLTGGAGFGGLAGAGGGRGGRGGGFRGFNPTQPHGAFFYQGGFSALDAQQFSLSGTPTPKQSSSQNRYGVSFTGSPSIPGVLKASSKQFIFVNVTGSRSTNPLNLYGTVPTALERTGDFSQSSQFANGAPIPVSLFDPATGRPFAPSSPGSTPAQVLPAARITPQAQALLQFYPLPNVANASTRNFQNITTQGVNSTNAAARFVRNFGAGGFGLGGFGGGGRRGTNAPKALRQNLNAGFSYAHNAQDLRNIIPILGGNDTTDGFGLSAGYTVGYGRFTNNASLNWNRSRANTRNYFTNTVLNPAAQADVQLPTSGAQLAQNGFYNGVPNIELTNFTSLSEQTPRDAINQTISFSDFISYSHAKHNLRFGGDLRRVHTDQIGGNDVVGTFVFSGLVTQDPGMHAATSTRQPTSGSAFADFLLGQPQQTKIQAGLFKTHLRETVFDLFAQDDFRVASGLTLNYGLRYEYFGPFVEINNRLVNLDHNADFTAVQPVLPDATGPFLGSFPRSLVNPDYALFSPRIGLAWRPKQLKQTVVRTGYGINYNTGQYATFAESLAFQPPFAVTQNNVLSTANNQTGCVVTTPGKPTNLTLANGFSCATKPVTNTFAVNKNYRLGHVQVFNLDIQRTLPHGVVLNLGYNGSRGGNLDIVRAPNATATSVTTANAQAFTYEDSVATSRLNQLVFSARKRLERGVALQAVYQYGHSIDNASSIGGSAVTQVQDDRRLDLEEANSSFDLRHRLTGNFVLELPFGPNRLFLNQGGIAAKTLDGFGLSGDFTFASGTFFTPRYVNTAAQLAAGGTYTLRPDRVFSQPIAGAGTSGSYFNPAAFTAPQNGFGTASRNSIAGPGTVSFNMSLGRTVTFGNTRSFEARMTAANVFNTVQYSGIDTVVNSATFGQVLSTASQRRVSFVARYRF